jgi:CPA2 family monovalent cation:H+ antiporter-2
LQVDLRFIWEHLGVIALALFYITIGKTVLNIAVLRLFRFSLPDSFIISVLLGHIGEFSFMLAFAASKVGLIEEMELKFLISLTALSLFLSPFWLIFAERCRRLTVSALESSAWNLFLLVVAKEKRKLLIVFDFIGKFCKVSYDFISEKVKSGSEVQNKE